MKTYSDAALENVALTGAYLMLGFMNLSRDDRIAVVGDRGHIDFVAGMCTFASYINDLAEAAYDVEDDYPGVMDYEVTEAFGEWYARQTLETGGVPTYHVCQDWLRTSMYAFFARNEPVRADSPLWQALSRVQL